jgi:hypothetical protein
LILGVPTVGSEEIQGFFPSAGYNLMKARPPREKETMQSAKSDRTGVFILALPPWVIAIASAGAVASDGSGAGGDVGDHLGLQDSRIREIAVVANFLRV